MPSTCTSARTPLLATAGFASPKLAPLRLHVSAACHFETLPSKPDASILLRRGMSSSPAALGVSFGRFVSATICRSRRHASSSRQATARARFSFPIGKIACCNDRSITFWRRSWIRYSNRVRSPNIGDLVRFVAIPEEWCRPNNTVHKECADFMKSKIRRTWLSRINKIDESGFPWIRAMIKQRGKWRYHSWMIVESTGWRLVIAVSDSATRLRQIPIQKSPDLTECSTALCGSSRFSAQQQTWDPDAEFHAPRPGPHRCVQPQPAPA